MYHFGVAMRLDPVGFFPLSLISKSLREAPSNSISTSWDKIDHREETCQRHQ